MIISYYKIG